MGYRQGSYAYGGNKGYYTGVSGWTSTYPDDGVEYVNYPPYPIMNQDPVHMMQGYGRYGSSKSVYVDPESSGYSYGNLVHRPAGSSDSPNFSLSGMADSLPSTSSARVVPSDRLLPQVTRTLAHSSSYRTDGLPEQQQYSSKSTTSSHHSSSSNTLSDGYGSMSSNFESPVSYNATGTVPSNNNAISHRSASQSDSTSYQQPSTTITTTSTSSATADTMYHNNDPSPLRPTDDPGTSVSYIYSNRDSVRRDSHSSGGGASTLSNGHLYVPGSHHQHHHHVHPHHHHNTQGYVVSGPSVSASASLSQGTVVEGATTAATRSGGHNGSTHLHAESHRRSAGSLRGGG